MNDTVISAVISLLETTLGNVSSSDADKVVRSCIEILRVHNRPNIPNCNVGAGTGSGATPGTHIY